MRRNFPFTEREQNTIRNATYPSETLQTLPGCASLKFGGPKAAAANVKDLRSLAISAGKQTPYPLSLRVAGRFYAANVSVQIVRRNRELDAPHSTEAALD